MAIHPLRAALTLLLAVPLLVLSAGGPAHACSCAEQTPQGLATSDVAFAGTVEDSRTSLTRFAVDRVWTGDVARITEVVHGSMEAACGPTMRDGPPWRRIGIGAGLLLALVAAVVVRRRAWD